jgi:plastocyanin
MKRSFVLVVALACASSLMTLPALANAPHHVSRAKQVVIRDYSFIPEILQIHVGRKVAWTNRQNRTHTVTSDTGLFDSGRLRQGHRFSYTFTEVGTFNYHCAIHGGMTGSVEVTSG